MLQLANACQIALSLQLLDAHVDEAKRRGARIAPLGEHDRGLCDAGEEAAEGHGGAHDDDKTQNSRIDAAHRGGDVNTLPKVFVS